MPEHNSLTGTNLHAIERENVGTPDGVLSGIKGQYCIDTVTGIVYRNEDGTPSVPTTNWEPVSPASAIPVTDTDGLFTASQVEAVLREMGMKQRADLESFRLEDDLPPFRMSLFRNEEMDNELATASGTEIEVVSVDIVANTIILSWLPYIPSIWDPETDKEWALANLETWSGADPGISGDAADVLKITGGDYATKTLNYVVIVGAEGNWLATHRVALYNPHAFGWDWGTSPIIEKGAATWRNTYVSPGPVFQHSDGRYIMIVNAKSSGSPNYQAGAFECDPDDFPDTWTVMNSDLPIFLVTGAAWCANGISLLPKIYWLASEKRYIAFCHGKNAGNRWGVGWVKFDEDFSADSMEYSADVIITLGANIDHSYPCVVPWGGKWACFFTKDPDTTNGVLTDWLLRVAYADTPEGPYTEDSTIWTCGTTNDGSIYSNHMTVPSIFKYRGKIYMLLPGAPRYKYSGMRSNYGIGILEYNDGPGVAGWYVSTISPLINPMYATTNLWPDFESWACDHWGGPFNFVVKDNYAYLILACGAGTDSYRIGYAKRLLI